MKALYSVLLIIMVAFLYSCSNEQVVVLENEAQDKKLSDDNVFKGYETAVDKAKGVEKTIQDAAQLKQEEILERGY